MADHAQCHRDIDGLLAEINRLQGLLNRIGDLIVENQTYHVERIAAEGKEMIAQGRVLLPKSSTPDPYLGAHSDGSECAT